MGKNSEYLTQSVPHALDLLEQFRGEVEEQGVTELSKRMKLHKTKAFRLLATLESRGYIEQNKVTENYRLGLKTLELGQTFIHQMGLLRESKPVLEDLVRVCNETSYVSIIKDYNIVYLDVVETDMIVRVLPRIGSRLPAYCTAAGKIQLAHMSNEGLEKYFEQRELKPYTDKTTTDREELKKQLRLVVENGYAVDDEEMDIGVKCLSAPIRDYTRRIIGAVSISGPSMRFSYERMKNELIPLALRASEVISTRLGFQ